MTKANSWETALLQHLFQNANVANIGDATGIRGSSTAGSLYISLHTADPGEAGDQTTNEIATADYENYARVAVARTSGAWTVSADNVTNAAAITFPQAGAATSGTGIVTHFGIGTATSGAGVLLYKGALTSSLTISTNVTPEFAAGALNVNEE